SLQNKYPGFQDDPRPAARVASRDHAPDAYAARLKEKACALVDPGTGQTKNKPDPFPGRHHGKATYARWTPRGRSWHSGRWPRNPLPAVSPSRAAYRT